MVALDKNRNGAQDLHTEFLQSHEGDSAIDMLSSILAKL